MTPPDAGPGVARTAWRGDAPEPAARFRVGAEIEEEGDHVPLPLLPGLGEGGLGAVRQPAAGHLADGVREGPIPVEGLAHRPQVARRDRVHELGLGPVAPRLLPLLLDPAAPREREEEIRGHEVAPTHGLAHYSCLGAEVKSRYTIRPVSPSSSPTARALRSPAGRGCVLGLALWASTTMALFLARRPAHLSDYADRLFMDLIGGAIAAFGLSLLVTVGQRLREWRWIRRAQRGTPLGDGRRGAAIGRISAPEGGAVAAPYTGRPCAIYEYEAYHLEARTRGRSAEVKSYWGRHMVPCAVESPQGSIRLFAWPELEFLPESLSGPEVHDRARRHVHETCWSHVGSDDTGQKLTRAEEMFWNDSGTLAWDFSSGDKDVAALHFRESRVEVGETVCALGLYSASRGGFVPDSRWIGFPIRIVKGDPARMAGERLQAAVSMLVLSVVVTGLGLALSLLLPVG